MLENGKYKGRVTTYGFRATFRNICILHKAKLFQKGISDEVIESDLTHKANDEVKFAYEREKATLEQQRILMQWYRDYLNGLRELELQSCLFWHLLLCFNLYQISLHSHLLALLNAFLS